MPVEYDYLDQRLENMREFVKQEIAWEFTRRETERSIRMTKVVTAAICLIGIVLWTIVLTLEFAS